MRTEVRVISRLLREKHFYKVPPAGAQIGLNRAQSYEAAANGTIPTERHGKFLLVPKRKWDAEVRRLLRGPSPTKRRTSRKPSAQASA